jgi:hypothetical protein
MDSSNSNVVDDLLQLHDLLTSNAAALARADLPKNAASRSLLLARTLRTGTAEERSESDARQPYILLRNRAYWWLREVIDVIRTCGRYAFRRDPTTAHHFRSTATRQREHARSGKPHEPATPSAAPAATPSATAPAPAKKHARKR